MQHGGGVTDAMTLQGDPAYWQHMNGADLLGLAPGGSRVRAAGQSLPLTTTGYGDQQAVWWHPDSPTFWVAVIAGATGLLIAGASVRVRVGREQAGASIGKERPE